MKPIKMPVYDKTKWGPGPWDNEPDRVEFTHVGLPCLLLRGPLGCWCGYVAVGPDHPFHGKHYDNVPVEVHGGLTYGAVCNGTICHVPKPGEPANVWWLGFDCGHYMDLAPSMLEYKRDGEYRNVQYARIETEKLAEQLKALADG